MERPELVVGQTIRLIDNYQATEYDAEVLEIDFEIDEWTNVPYHLGMIEDGSFIIFFVSEITGLRKASFNQRDVRED